MRPAGRRGLFFDQSPLVFARWIVVASDLRIFYGTVKKHLRAAGRILGIMGGCQDRNFKAARCRFVTPDPLQRVRQQLLLFGRVRLFPEVLQNLSSALLLLFMLCFGFCVFRLVPQRGNSRTAQRHAQFFRHHVDI